MTFPIQTRSPLLVALLACAASAQFDAYSWELKAGAWGGGMTKITGDQLDIELDPLCSIGYADSGWARTAPAETGRFRFDYSATSLACVGFGGFCDQARFLALSGPCDCPIPIQPTPCVDELAKFNNGQSYAQGAPQMSLAGTWEVDVLRGDCLRIAAATSGFTLDCQILATFTNLSFTPALVAARGSLSLAAGGVQAMQLTGPQELAGEPYLLLGTKSGTQPGIAVDGLVLPLNVDPYLLHTLANPYGPPLAGAFGLLDAAGKASATLTLPTGTNPALAGLVLHHAFAAFDLTSAPASPFVAFVSDAVPLQLLP